MRAPKQLPDQRLLTPFTAKPPICSPRTLRKTILRSRHEPWLYRKRAAYKEFVCLASESESKSLKELLGQIERQFANEDPFLNNPLFKHFLVDKFYFVVFSKLFGAPNDLLSDRYRPLFAEHCFDTSIATKLAFFLSNFVHKEDRLEDSENSFEDLFKPSNRANRRKEKMAAIVAGEPGSGKLSTVKALLRSLEVEAEIVSSLQYDSLKEVAAKYSLAVTTEDVVSNIKSAFGLLGNCSASISVYRSFSQKTGVRDIAPSSIQQVLCRKDNRSDHKLNNKRVFLVTDIDLILDKETLKSRKTKLAQFLRFVKHSRHPFVFVHSKNANSLFEKSLSNFEVLEAKRPNPLELAAFLFLILTVERNLLANPNSCTFAPSEEQLVSGFKNVREFVEERLREVQSFRRRTLAFPSIRKILYLVHSHHGNLHSVFSFLETNIEFMFSESVCSLDNYQTRSECYFSLQNKWFFNHEFVVSKALKELVAAGFPDLASGKRSTAKRVQIERFHVVEERFEFQGEEARGGLLESKNSALGYSWSQRKDPENRLFSKVDFLVDWSVQLSY